MKMIEDDKDDRIAINHDSAMQIIKQPCRFRPAQRATPVFLPQFEWLTVGHGRLLLQTLVQVPSGGESRSKD
jgi:hypothetical protein